MHLSNASIMLQLSFIVSVISHATILYDLLRTHALLIVYVTVFAITGLVYTIYEFFAKLVVIHNYSYHCTVYPVLKLNLTGLFF